jgi:hypothetical protein
MRWHSCFKQKRNAYCGATVFASLDRLRGFRSFADFYTMKRRWLVIPFLLCWLSLWTYGGWETGKQLAQHFEFFEFAWMGMWAFVEFWAIAWCLRNLGGRDTVTVNGDTLAIRKQIFGIGLAKTYSTSEARDL